MFLRIWVTLKIGIKLLYNKIMSDWEWLKVIVNDWKWLRMIEKWEISILDDLFMLVGTCEIS